MEINIYFTVKSLWTIVFHNVYQGCIQEFYPRAVQSLSFKTLPSPPSLSLPPSSFPRLFPFHPPPCLPSVLPPPLPSLKPAHHGWAGWENFGICESLGSFKSHLQQQKFPDIFFDQMTSLILYNMRCIVMI